MPALKSQVQDPADRLDYTIAWGAYLKGGDTITSAQWTAPGVTITAPVYDERTASAWIEAPAGSYTVNCRVTTTLGRVIERSFALTVREL